MDVFGTPDRKIRASPESRYENSQSRRGSPAYDKHAKVGGNSNTGTPSKVLRPINQNVSVMLISPKRISELGVRKPSQKESDWPKKSAKGSQNERNFALIEKNSPETPGGSRPKDFYKNEPHDIEEEFKLFYSVSKILDDSLSEQNSFARSPFKKTESPPKPQLIKKTLKEVNTKLEDLKDNLPTKTVYRAISKINMKSELLIN